MGLHPDDSAAEWKRLSSLPDVKRAMQIRCEVQDHDWENGLTVLFQFVLVCRWCGGYRR
jgi:hypothetical protein